MKITLQKIQAQYLYALCSKIPGNTIYNIRLLKSIFNIIHDQLIEFENEWTKISNGIKELQEQRNQIVDMGQAKEKEAEINELVQRMEGYANDIDKLHAEEMDIEFETQEQINFILAGAEDMLQREINDANGNAIRGINGRNELNVFDAVYTALENAS